MTTSREACCHFLHFFSSSAKDNDKLGGSLSSLDFFSSCVENDDDEQFKAKIRSTGTPEKPLIYFFFLYSSLKKKFHSCLDFLYKFF